jgi:hypothetical protein
MSEVLGFPEQDPSRVEAEQADIELLEAAIREIVNANSRSDYSTEQEGGCSFSIDEEKLDSLHVSYRNFGSDAVPIDDWCYKEPVPNATSCWIRFREEQHTTGRKLSRHCEVEEIMITVTPEGKQIRRKVYGSEQFNYALLDELGNEEYNRVEKKFREDQEVKLRQQRESDKLEEELGLNRVTKSQIRELITLLSEVDRAS